MTTNNDEVFYARFQLIPMYREDPGKSTSGGGSTGGSAAGGRGREHGAGGGGGGAHAVVRGLVNIGLTCYMSAVLQCLFVAGPLLALARSESNCALCDSLLAVSDAVTSPDYDERLVRGHLRKIRTLLNAAPARFPERQQHDAHEFALAFVDRLPAALRELFEWQFAQRVICNECETETTGLLLETLCLLTPAAATLDQVMETDLSWQNFKKNCANCGYDVARRQWTLVHAPTIACIALKRYAFDRETGVVSKNEAPVTVSTELTLQSQRYDLRAIVTHDGDSPTSGHYKAVTRRGNGWVEFDDKQIRGLSARFLAQKAITMQSYLLFYARSE